MLFDREEIKKAWLELRATGGLRTVVARKEQSGIDRKRKKEGERVEEEAEGLEGKKGEKGCLDYR